ncbi:DUF1365 domain-containing protein [Robbsia sp. Bb-Pol-6]|uniref:DUF1365 domain-containing protein n=1 Tax=Robbsia betulipollinis TaxID=2981849 RepID=A0ABT3ZHF8_9BURK|nr:DUF1365 domain-containing protein [Robbsia betulipollinis]MCY0385958.1 DUF1365 domain-containing protein [Robbsia betulipollinis]
MTTGPAAMRRPPGPAASAPGPDAPPKPAAVLYVGSVSHQRRAPRAHRLRYRIFSMLLDLDRLDDAVRQTRLFSRNRFNLYSFHDRDHGERSAVPLRVQIDRLLERADVDLAGGRVELLCMPRVLGYVFNPLSVYYCYARDGTLAALVYEVSNTFGQRHTYVIPVAPDAPGAAPGTSVPDRAPRAIEQSCRKRFHVSPFLGRDMTYRFRVVRPDARLSVLIDAFDDPGPAVAAAPPQAILSAAYGAQRRGLTDGALLRLFVTHPLLTLKVVVGIHWEALQLWYKGSGFRPCPPPGDALTVVRLADIARPHDRFASSRFASSRFSSSRFSSSDSKEVQ